MGAPSSQASQSVPFFQHLVRGDPPGGDDFPLSLRNVEDLLAERGVDICHETVRHWWSRFGPMFAANRVENSHLPFRRRERAMLRFRRMKSLQKFASVHANVHNHFSQERHLVDRKTHEACRSAALAECQSLTA